jgi:alpha-L-rhamnosidase
VIVPWTMYLVYGDARILEESYDSMKKWVGYMRQRAGDRLLWQGDEHFGDWLAYATTRSDYPGATTDKDLLATAHFAYSTGLVARAAKILGRDADATELNALQSRVKAAFLEEYVTPNGRLASNTQTAYALALAFDLLPEPLRPQAARRLADDVRRFGHVTTGFLGAPLVCHVLTDYGYFDEAFRLVNRNRYPSWLYPITKGATTIWERWDGIKPDGSFQDEGMNSFNHYAYGAIGEWMYRVMAGLEIDEAQPGYKHFFVQPRPGGTITAASAAHETPYGRASSSWSVADTRIELTVDVPPNTTATIRVPGAPLASVTEGGKALQGLDGIRATRQDGRDAVIDVGSGHYVFAGTRVP